MSRFGKRPGVLGLIAAVSFAAVVCSRQGDQPASAPAAADANIAAADMGGAIEELTDNYGPGFTGRRLIDGLMDPTWKIDTFAKNPQDVLISFYDRQPAVIKAV